MKSFSKTEEIREGTVELAYTSFISDCGMMYAPSSYTVLRTLILYMDILG